MTELLALPSWDLAPTSLPRWVEVLELQGVPVSVTRESAGVSWIEGPALRLRGYVLLQGDHVEAINFELHAADPAPARRAVVAAAEALGWEVHDDDDAEQDDDVDED